MIKQNLNNFSKILLLNKKLSSYLDKVHSNSDQSNPESAKHIFAKLPYIGKYSEDVQKKLSRIFKLFYKDPDLEIYFPSFKINNSFSTNVKTSYFLKPFLVYKFVCARCSSCFIGESYCHFKTRIDEHVKKDKSIYISIYTLYINIYTIIKSVSQVVIQIVFLFYITLQHSFKLRLKKVCILTGRSRTLTTK